MMSFAFTSATKFGNPNVVWSMKVSSYWLYFAVPLTDRKPSWLAVRRYQRQIGVHNRSLLSPPSLNDNILKLLSAPDMGFGREYDGGEMGLTVYQSILGDHLRLCARNWFRFACSYQVVCIAIGSTAAIDSTIAITMTVVLYKMIPLSPVRRGIHTVHQLVLFFIATGMLTAVCAVIRLALFASDPSSTMYLALHFAVPRLYVNSILAFHGPELDLNSPDHLTTIIGEISIPYDMGIGREIIEFIFTMGAGVF
ncbi:hypothetical protein CVT25_004072 [Psilocybe cyanescens]|uniref:DUF6534 domain-containing protein n=1 Tax=Psilocybe cyanescens TaxID=93625 RepID=A0A409XQ19_PSICY|nr:hypothetical protein CVT25_004072 [Psilocybe cyanescens]